MTQYDNTNRGVLFKNDRKAKDSHPDYTGSLNVDGVEHFLDAWIREGKSGKFMSVSVKRKDKQGGTSRPPAPAPAPRGGGSSFPDDDGPFAPLASGRSFLAV